MSPKSLIILCFIPLFLQAQQSKPFKIIGRSDHYNNRQLIVAVGAHPIYNDCTLSASKADTGFDPRVMVQNGKFEVFGTLRYPHPLYVSHYDAEKNQGWRSYFYFIDGGDVHISVEELESNRVLSNDMNTKSHREYQQLKKIYSGVVDTLTGVVSDMLAKQKLMRGYIAAHPDSYVALWDLLFDYAWTRSDSVRESILENMELFSPQVKESNTYQALFKDLKKDMDIAVGRQFPDIDLRPSVSIKATAKGNKFTLLEFWASWCKPCLQQLPGLKEVYTSYKGKGFTIIGISVDNKEDERDWQRVVKKFNLKWPQYWDVDSKETLRINVNSYPSNFLLDDKGVIIRKDLSPEELKEFLEMNLTIAGGKK